MKLYMKLFLLLSSFLFIVPGFAAGNIDHFKVVFGKETAKVGESLDITISAVDKNSEVVRDYVGSILVFSESDVEAKFPNDLVENSYSFTAANEWSVKFENAVRFKNPGVQDVYVYDLNDENILGVAEVTITAKEVLSNVDIKILSPENGVTLWKNNITVSGTTKKNHQVRIILNDSQDLFTTSNAEGVFEKKVENLQEWTNTLQAQVLNADNEKIGESKKIDVKINSSVPILKSISITPPWKVEANSEISIKVISNIWLSEVSVIINDVITQLKEEKEGIYTASSNAPEEAGTYWIDVILKDEFAHETKEMNAATLEVTALPDLKVGDDTAIVENIEATNTGVTMENLDLTIKDIQVTELKTKSVLTWKPLKDAESYNVYKKISDTQIELIENVTDPRFEIDIIWDEIKYDEFAIKAIGKTSSGELIQWNLSEMTKVQTGPEMYIILALIALLFTAGIFFLKRHKA